MDLVWSPGSIASGCSRWPVEIWKDNSGSRTHGQPARVGVDLPLVDVPAVLVRLRLEDATPRA